MGWFSNLSANRKINRMITEHEDRFETIERRLKSLDLEFSELYDKTRHALSRMAKRAKVIETQEPEEEGSAPLTDSPSDGLSAHQRKINDLILAYRGMRGGTS